MFEQKLSEKITYAEGGQQIKTDVVEVCAPSKKQYRKTYLLQQIVAKALIAAQKLSSGDSKKESSESGTIEPADMKMLLMAGDADLEACVIQVEKLALDGCVKVAGNKINAVQWGKVDPIDQEEIACRFIADFIMPLV